MVVKVGIAKLGNIASGVMAELLLDERGGPPIMNIFRAHGAGITPTVVRT